MKKIGVARFPGTNCDRDVFQFVQARNCVPEFLWHENQFPVDQYEAVIVPGGFSYGDYLRSGALAARSSVMKSIREFANKGGPVLGICNGFQILCEAGLLPGALVRNNGQRFKDQWVELRCEKRNAFFGKDLPLRIKLPIAHGDGRFFAPKEMLNDIEGNHQVWLRYINENPNGSMHDIAGVMNKKGNVAGLMPHPERALFDWMGGTDGWGFL